METDGPIPGPFSLLSFALTVVGSFDGHTLQLLKPGSVTLYRELRPISDEFEPEALQVNGLDREQLQRTGADPSAAMEEAARSCLDIRTLYQVAAGTVHDVSGKANMPPELLPPQPHMHNALDDAIEQGQLFANVFAWVLGTRRATDDDRPRRSRALVGAVARRPRHVAGRAGGHPWRSEASYGVRPASAGRRR